MTSQDSFIACTTMGTLRCVSVITTTVALFTAAIVEAAYGTESVRHWNVVFTSVTTPFKVNTRACMMCMWLKPWPCCSTQPVRTISDSDGHSRCLIDCQPDSKSQIRISCVRCGLHAAKLLSIRRTRSMNPESPLAHEQRSVPNIHTVVRLPN